MSVRRLLIIEDDPGLQSQMRWCFDDLDVSVAGTEKEALAALEQVQPQVVTLDLGIPPDPGGTEVGFRVLSSIQSRLPAAKVIVITGREEHEHALHAIGSGAYDYYQKPIDADTLSFVVGRAFRLWELEEENRRLVSQQAKHGLEGLISNDVSMLQVCRLVERVAPTNATVLILGETGTGKEVVARAIHNLSERKDGPFVAINCAAIPEQLLESELFGHEKGAFTGATSRKIGKIENANGGTLLLDEIGDMPLALQAKILRFLQERTIDRVGGREPIPVDVRVLSATHRDVQTMIADQTFREDLYFRLGEISLTIPPLRERPNDVLMIAQTLLQRFAPDRKLRFSDGAKGAMRAWPWTGNVRELENRVKRASIMAEGNLVQPADLELADAPNVASLNLKQARDDVERKTLLAALDRAGSNMAQAARLLGVSRPTLYDLLSKHQINNQSKAEQERG
jgi:two-component system, NtrC family, response regulator